MAQWGMKSKVGKAPSKGQRESSEAQRSSSAAVWQESRTGRSAVGQEAIAKRAYEKWLARGGRHGDDQRDWYEAERELSARAGRSSN